MFADDWKHFKERFSGLEETDKEFIDRMSGLDDAADGGSQRKNDSKAIKKSGNQKKIEDDGLELCLWASYRGQTLARTVRGMMYYERSGLVPVLSVISFSICQTVSVFFLLFTGLVMNL